MNKRLRAFATVVGVVIVGGGLAAGVTFALFALATITGSVWALIILWSVLALAGGLLAYWVTDEGADND